MIPATQGASRTQSIDTSNATNIADAGGSASLLREPRADATTSLMILMVTLSKEQRSEASSQEQTALKQEAAADADRVQQLHEKADAAFTSGLVTGALDVASGALTCASAVMTTRANSDELEMKKGLADNTFSQNSDIHLSKLGAINNMKAWTAVSDVASHGVTVGKDITGGTFSKIQGDHDADAAAAEASSHRSAGQVNQAHEMKKQADDDRRFVLDWFKKLQDTQNETNNALARRA